jgi:homoserine dehydrogenase
VLPRAAVRTRHYLRVPVHGAAGLEAVAELLQRQGVPVQRVEWMVGNTDTARQVLVLTDEAPQGALDLAVHALQALPEVAGPCVQWRVELLAG